MLENCAVERKQISVLKLSNITQSLEDDLLELGIDSINIEASTFKSIGKTLLTWVASGGLSLRSCYVCDF